MAKGSRKVVGIVKADGSGFTKTDFSIARLNELRAGAAPESFGGDSGPHHPLPQYIDDGTMTAAEYAAYPYKDGGR